jgi:hypothetical protein
MLAFKRAQKAAEEAIAANIKALEGWGYGTTTWEVDWNSVQKLEGKNGHYKYQQEISNNETGALYIAEKGLKDINVFIYSYVWPNDLGIETFKKIGKFQLLLLILLLDISEKDFYNCGQ